MSTQPSEPNHDVNLYGSGGVDMHTGATQDVVTQLGNAARDLEATHQRIEAILRGVEAAMSPGAASGNPVDVTANQQVTQGMEQVRALLPDARDALSGTASKGSKAVAQYLEADQAAAQRLRSSGSR